MGVKHRKANTAVLFRKQRWLKKGEEIWHKQAMPSLAIHPCKRTSF